MMRCILISFVLLLFPLSDMVVMAQTVIRGMVTELNSEHKVDGATLLLIDAQTKQSVSITQSNPDGSFVFESRKKLQAGQQFILQGMLLGYKPLKQEMLYRADMILHIQMEPTSYALREVVIKAPAVKDVGDTIVYRTSAYALRQDETLSQVLERMPGIDVTGGGQIKFEGKPINKFYIEQMDLLGRRYSIASNSLRPEDVAAIEIYRNHESIKMLEAQSLSDRAALNVRLTKKAKGRWLAWLAAGIGASPFLYDLNARFMRFDATMQGLYFVKANDTGKDVLAELRAHELSMSRKLTFSLRDYASPDFYQSMGESLKASPIGKRQRFNQTYVLSGNQLVKIDENKFLRLNAIYSEERFNSSRAENISYVLADGALQNLSGNQRYFTRERKMVLEGDYEYNGKSSFLNNKTKIEHQKRSSDDNLLQDAQSYNQSISLPYLKLENSTAYMFRLGRIIIAVDNVAKYLMRNQSMTISLPRSQSIESQLVDNSFAVRADWQWGLHQLSNTMQWDVQYHHIDVKSSWIAQPTKDTSKYFSHSIGYTPRYDWKDDAWHLTAELPMRYYLYRYPHIHESFVKSDLYLSLRRKWPNNLKLEGSYRYSHNLVGAASQFPGLKLIDSRRLSEIRPYPYQGNYHLANFNLSYTVPVSGTAISAGGYVSKSKQLYTSSNYVQDGILTFSQIERPSQSSEFGANLSFAQTFLQGKMDVSVQGLYDRRWSEFFVQKQVVPLVSDNYSASVNISYRITSDLKIDYTSSLNSLISKTHLTPQMPLPEVLNQKHQCAVHLWLSDEWSGITKAEYHSTHQGACPHAATAAFWDVGIKYHGKRMTIDLLLSNITNQKTYESITLKAPYTYTVTTPLRPFEVLLTLALKR